MENNDEKLVAEFLLGDEKAFELLLNRYLKHVYNFIYQFTKDASVSEDLTQETFIKAWKNLGKFDQEKKFKVWLFTIAKNSAYDWLKKKKTITFSFFENEDGSNVLENIEEDKILATEILERAEIAKELEDKLLEIPEKYRMILVLKYKEDFALNEIAQILKIPYNTIKSSHKRALLSLKKVLTEKSASK